MIASKPRGLGDAVAPPERRGVARDRVRMLVTNRSQRTHAHARFDDLPSFLRAGDLVVVNDSLTLPAALHAVRPNGQELALHVSTRIDGRIWMAEPRGAVTCGEELALPNGASAVAVAPVDAERPRLWYIWFQLPQPMHDYLRRHGEPIRYGYVPQRLPIDDYQTMFARVPGSSEMPSAARPFTPRVVRSLYASGVELATITLHCGVASFEAPELPPAEWYVVPHATAAAVNKARSRGGRVIGIGTTVVRALESAALDGRAAASSGWTDLVVDERRDIALVDALLTGFHDTTATHRWLLRAFLDENVLEEAYDAAIDAGYLRHEFGDVHLIV